jgi:ketosteroid isomerase-like protein
MKHLSAAALLLIFIPQGLITGEASSKPNDALRSELLAVRESVWKAWFNNDQYALKRLLPEELIAINNGDSEWQGLDKTLASARGFAARGGKLISLRFDRTEMQVYGDVAVLYSIFTFETDEKGKRTKTSGRATEIFQRRGKSWVNTGWHLDSGS